MSLVLLTKNTFSYSPFYFYYLNLNRINEVSNNRLKSPRCYKSIPILNIKCLASVIHLRHEKRILKTSNFMLYFMNFLSNNRKVIPITIGIFIYWIKFSFKRHANLSFSHKFTCLFQKAFAMNFRDEKKNKEC